MSDTPTLIYLEADDEVTTVVRRLRQVEGERVVLVAPGRSRATSSVVALRLLARVGEEAGVTIAVAGDALTRSLAAEAGLDTYASVEDARNARPAAPAEAPTRQASIHVVRGEAASDETAPVPLSAVVAPAAAAPIEEATQQRPVAVGAVGAHARSRPWWRARPAGGDPGAARAAGRRRWRPGSHSPSGGHDPRHAAQRADRPRRLRNLGAGPRTRRGARLRRPPRSLPQAPTRSRPRPSGPSCCSTSTRSTSRGRRAPSWPPASRHSARQADVVVPRGTLTRRGHHPAGEQRGRRGRGASSARPRTSRRRRSTRSLSQDVDQRLRGFPNNTERLVLNPEATAGGIDTTGTEITQADVDTAVASAPRRPRRAAGRSARLEWRRGLRRRGRSRPSRSSRASTGSSAPATSPRRRSPGRSPTTGCRSIAPTWSHSRRSSWRRMRRCSHRATRCCPIATRVTIGEARVEGDGLVVAVSVTGASAPSPDPMRSCDACGVVRRRRRTPPSSSWARRPSSLWPGWVQTVPGARLADRPPHRQRGQRASRRRRRREHDHRPRPWRPAHRRGGRRHGDRHGLRAAGDPSTQPGRRPARGRAARLGRGCRARRRRPAVEHGRQRGRPGSRGPQLWRVV